MRCFAISVLAAQIILLAAQSGDAQTAFEQLEQQVRTAVGQAARRAAATSSPPRAGAAGAGLFGPDRRRSPNVGQRHSRDGNRFCGPAEQAGLKTGDLITGVNSQPVRSMDDFARTMRPRRPEPNSRSRSSGTRGTMPSTWCLSKRPPPDQRRFQQFGQIPEPVSAPPAEGRNASGIVGRADRRGHARDATGPASPLVGRGIDRFGGARHAGRQGGHSARRNGRPVDGKPIERGRSDACRWSEKPGQAGRSS